MYKYVKIFILIFLHIYSAKVMSLPVGLEGDVIDAAMIRTIESPFYGSGRICCYGLDSPFVVENGSGDQKQYSSSFLLDVNSLSFDINYIGLGGWQEGIVLRLSDLDFDNNSNYLSDLVINTNVAGLTWLVGVDYIDLNIGGTKQDEGLYISGTFIVTSVPEPTSFSLLLLAFIFFALKATYSKNASVIGVNGDIPTYAH